MMKTVLKFAAGALVTACGLTLFSQQSLADTPDPWLLVPGHQAGHIILGEKAGTLLNQMPVSDGGDASMGRDWYTWNGSGGNHLEVLTERDAAGSNDWVEQIHVQSPAFKTWDGYGVGSTLKQLKADFPELRRLGVYSAFRDQKVLVYDVKDQGIAFDFPVGRRPAKCIGVMIYQQNTGVADHYAPYYQKS